MLGIGVGVGLLALMLSTEKEKKGRKDLNIGSNWAIVRELPPPMPPPSSRKAEPASAWDWGSVRGLHL